MRRALRQTLAAMARMMPDWIRGRVRLGAFVDRCLAATGYERWLETVSCADGVRMTLDTNENQQSQIYWTGSYEPQAVAALVRHLPHQGVFVDVGAGIGGVCLFVTSQCLVSGKSIHVHAFEPLSINYQRLLHNSEQNSLTNHVHCHRIALGAEESELTLCFRPEVGAPAVMHSGAAVSAYVGPNLERVPVVTLDAWVDGYGLSRLDVLKVDIEGAEPIMFRGAMRTIERFLPVIQGEFNHWWAERHGLSVSDECFAPLWGLGYRAFRQSSRRRRWLEIHGRPRPGPDMEDTLWIPSGRKA